MEADISIWRKTGHFYFALTLALRAFVGTLVSKKRAGDASMFS